MNENNISQEELKLLVEHEFLNRFNHTSHAYIDIAEDLVAGTLLSQIIYWFTPSKDKKNKLRVFKNGYYWLVKRREDWYPEIRISSKQFDTAIKKLIDKKFVEVQNYKFNGSQTKHIRLLFENINPAIAKWKTNVAKQICGDNCEIPEWDDLKSPNKEFRNPPMGKFQLPNEFISITENTTEITNQRIHTKTLSGERAVSECEQPKEKETSNKTARKKEANALFEQLWSLYPLKKGKGNVSDSQKAKLLEIGYEELERAISRYIRYVESIDYLHYKNGSTFFNSGYIDYLDANYECSDNNNKPSVKPENYNNQKPEDENQSEQDFKTKLEAAKKKAIHDLKLDDNYWEGVSDENAEIYLEMLGIYL